MTVQRWDLAVSRSRFLIGAHGADTPEGVEPFTPMQGRVLPALGHRNFPWQRSVLSIPSVDEGRIALSTRRACGAGICVDSYSMPIPRRRSAFRRGLTARGVDHAAVARDALVSRSPNARLSRVRAQ